MAQGPPDPSRGNTFDDRIRALVYQALSDPLSFPDPFTSWVSNQITLQTPATVGSTTGINTQPPTI